MAEEPIVSIYNDFLRRLAPLISSSAQMLRYANSANLVTGANPLNLCGAKVYSQNEEDGITFEILRRLGLHSGAFAEFGVGNGTENNTLALAAAGWKGFWVGGEELAFKFNPINARRLNFHFQQAWVKRSNIVELFRRGQSAINAAHCDVVSLDLDGNDYYFADTLLGAGVQPALFIVEYNAKFIPPIRFKIAYDDEHRWKGDDYFGASLCSFVDLFEAHGYFLACCNATGSNAFFVKSDYRERFSDIPTEISRLYAVPKYFLTGLDSSGHPTSIATIESFMGQLNSPDRSR